MGTSGAQTRLGGTLSARNVPGSSVKSAVISAAALQVIHASSTMTTQPVLRTEVRSVSLSMGTSVLGSTTSTAIPSRESSSAAASASGTILAMAITVTSRPSRLTSATPIGMVYSSSGTGPLALAASI